MALPLANPLTQRENSCERAPARWWRVPRALHLWHLCSLDAPTVAVVWTLAFSWTAGVHLNCWIALLIAVGTWTVYLAIVCWMCIARYAPAILTLCASATISIGADRRLLIPMACATAAIAAGLVACRMPVAVRSHDSVLAAAALIYFSGVHSSARLPRWLGRLASKELLVGLLFTAGCAAPTLSRLHSARWPFSACLVLFAALAWMNCTAIESWESRMHQTSVFLHTFVVSAVCVGASGAFLFMDARSSALACSAAMSALLLSLLNRMRTRVSPLTLRTLADLILLAPLALIIVGAR